MITSQRSSNMFERPSVQWQQPKEYYESHNPFLQNDSKYHMKNPKKIQQLKESQKLSNNSPQGLPKNIYAQKYNNYKALKDLQFNNPHLRGVSLPHLQKYYLDGDVNKRNDRYQMPNLSPIITQAKGNTQQDFKYSPQKGFVIQIDKATNLPQDVVRARVEFSVQDREGIIYSTNKTNQYSVTSNQGTNIYERKVLKNITNNQSNYIYIEFQGKPKNSKFYYEVSGVHLLFDKENNLITGKFKSPLYEVEENQDKLLNAIETNQVGRNLKPLGNTYVYYRIFYEGDDNLDNQYKIQNQDYLIPGVKQKSDRGKIGKVQVEPLKKRFDMEKLNNHMKEMQQISLKAGRRLKDPNDMPETIQNPEWLQEKMATEQEYQPQPQYSEQSGKKAPSKYQSGSSQPIKEQKKSQPFVYSPYNLSKDDQPPQYNINNKSQQQQQPQQQQQQPQPQQQKQQQQQPLKPQQQQQQQQQQQPPPQQSKYKQQVQLPKAVVQNAQNQLDKKHKFGGIHIRCIRMENYDEEAALAFDLYIMGPKGQVQDRTGQPCQAEADEVFDGDPTDRVCNMELDFELQINPYSIKDTHPDIYKQYHLVFNFLAEEDEDEGEIGWLAFPLFDAKGEFRTGVFQEVIFKHPLQEKIPYNYSIIQKQKEKFVFETKYIIMDH